MSDKEDILAQIESLEKSSDKSGGTNDKQELKAPPVDKSFLEKIGDRTATIADVPEALMEEWTRCMLGDIPFVYKVSVLKGKASFIFSDPTTEQSREMRAVSERLGTDSIAQTQLSIIAFLRGISGTKTMDLPWPDKLSTLANGGFVTAKDISILYEDMLSKLPRGYQRLIVGAWNIYSALISILTKESMPDSF